MITRIIRRKNKWETCTKGKYCADQGTFNEGRYMARSAADCTYTITPTSRQSTNRWRDHYGRQSAHCCGYGHDSSSLWLMRRRYERPPKPSLIASRIKTGTRYLITNYCVPSFSWARLKCVPILPVTSKKSLKVKMVKLLVRYKLISIILV